LIFTVTLNAAIDRTVAVPNFRQGNRHRAVESRTVAGGKGINVARALHALGRPVLATGLAGGTTGATLLEHLGAERILHDFTRIEAESRINLAVVDPTSGEQTEINERGPEVSEEELERFLRRLSYLAQGASICVLAGSVPPGIEPDVYARVVRELRDRGVTVVVDSEGEPMSAALRAAPAVVTPNVAETEGLVGHEFDGEGDLETGLAELLQLGAEEAIITRPEGCVAAVASRGSLRFYEVSVEPLEAVASVGSGDALVAGYVAARFERLPAEECLRYGVACGAESTRHFSAGTLDPEEVERIVPEVSVRELEVPAKV
jgi:1-phosphofructokinase family hexose kinase